MQQEQQKVAEILANDFGLLTDDLVSEERIIAALTWRVERLLAANPDQLFSMLYRLDVLEHKIKAAMEHAGADGIPKKIAVLIYERQLEKIISRKKFSSGKPDNDLAW
jgi:hypothetical protein